MKKLKSKKGFTLIEMMACILTLVLIVLICTTGTNMAMKSYNESLFETNSQMLESTINTALGDVLRYASNVTESTVGGVTTVKFTNTNYSLENGYIKIGMTEEDEGYLKLVVNDSGSADEKYLISKKSYAENLYILNFTLEYDATTGIFTGNYTIMSTIAAGMSRTVTFSYRSILA